MKKKVFFVDRYISYSTNLFRSLEQVCQTNELDLSFIGPKQVSLEKFLILLILSIGRGMLVNLIGKKKEISILIQLELR